MICLQRALLGVALVPAALYPSRAAAQYTAASIHFQHAGPYSEADLLTVTELKVGQTLQRNSLAVAAQHLMDTGLFDDVQAATTPGAARAVTFTLQPVPAEKLLPLSFANAVWWTPEKLAAALRERVPLYRGYASDAGNFADQVQQAMEKMLLEQGVIATVSHSIVEPSSAHPQRVIDVRVEKPEVRLATVHLSLTGPPTAAEELGPLLKPALARALRLPYNEGLSGETIEDLLLAPARDLGYITAALDKSERSFEFEAGNTSVGVTVTAHLMTGPVYRLGTVSFDPTPLYSAADFSRDDRLQAGEPAADSALQATEEAILKPYREQGYIDAYVKARATLDDEAQTVAYALQVVPGAVYKVGAVSAVGLSSAAQQEFDASFRLKAGDAYSEPYVVSWLKAHMAQPNFKHLTGSYKAVGNPQSHLVDLTLTFTPAP